VDLTRLAPKPTKPGPTLKYWPDVPFGATPRIVPKPHGFTELFKTLKNLQAQQRALQAKKKETTPLHNLHLQEHEAALAAFEKAFQKEAPQTLDYQGHPFLWDIPVPPPAPTPKPDNAAPPQFEPDTYPGGRKTKPTPLHQFPRHKSPKG